MENTGLNLWLEKFNRDIGYKSSVIVFGNTADIMLNSENNGAYEKVINILIAQAKKKGYKNIIKWDRADGIDTEISSPLSSGSPQQPAAGSYDLGSDFDSGAGSSQNRYKELGEFFPYMLNLIKNGQEETAFFLDYSDYLFGNPNSLSEAERNYLAVLGKALEKSQSYDINDINTFKKVKNIVIIVTHSSVMIPPAFYLNNSMVSLVSVPAPGHREREVFIDQNNSCLSISQNIKDNKNDKDDLIDALDGFSLRDIAQIMKLSQQLKNDSTETLSFEKLINLFKYGEKVSPWEELSRDKIAQIEQALGKRVKGQDAAISKVKDVIIRAFTGFSGLQHSAKQKKPKGTLFFVGPTGVGKTELAKSLAEFVFGDENACIRFDMSEYNHEHSDQRLVGAPPGYVGYEAGGQLTNAIKEKPFCVLLFDEIEKAHGKILDKFLQILEDGRLTDGKGETVYFSEAIIIFTSNIGAADADLTWQPAKIKQHFIDKVRGHFVENLGRPELLNRIGDNIVAFNFIDNPEVFKNIARLKFETVKNFVKEKYHATVSFEDEDMIFSAISQKAGRQNGGRGLLNIMETKIINPLSEFIFNNLKSLTDREIVIRFMVPPKKGEPICCEFQCDFK